MSLKCGCLSSMFFLTQLCKIFLFSEPAKFGSIWAGQPEFILWQCWRQREQQGGRAIRSHLPAPPPARANQPPGDHQQQPSSGGTSSVRWGPRAIFQYWNGISGQSGDHYQRSSNVIFHLQCSHIVILHLHIVAMTLKDTCSMLPTLGNYNTGHYNNNRFVKSRN